MFEKGEFLYAKLISPRETAGKSSNKMRAYPGTYIATWNNCIGFIWHGSRCLRNQPRHKFANEKPVYPKIISAKETAGKNSYNTNPDPVTYKSTWNNCIGFIWHGSRCLRNQVR